MSTTINDVARAANVSKATISRYLNDKSRVGEETAEKISKVIQELNYIPSATARNLALGQTDKLGILVSGVSSPFWNRVLESIHTQVSQTTTPYEIFTLNCDSMVLCNAHKSIQDKVHVLAEQRVAGIMICLRDLQQSDVDYICGMDIPFVVVQSNTTDERISYVNVDNYKASYEATQYLIQLGHRSIAYISGPIDAIYSSERFEGFRDVMLTKKLYRRTMVLQGDNTYPDGYWRMKQILSWKTRPTAVMLACDTMAYGAFLAIQEAGLKVPDDISILGFDGLREEVELFNMLPPLTSVLQPMSLIGEKTAELMLRQIRDKAAGKSKVYRAMLPTKFLDYGSCREV